MAGKQAKVLNNTQIEDSIIVFIRYTPPSARNTVMFLLSCKAGLRSVEISNIKWSMITDSEGKLDSFIYLQDRATKGKTGGRTIPMSSLLMSYLNRLDIPENLDTTVIVSERGNKMAASTVTSWFDRLYRNLNFSGCSSNSGRRTCGTMWARKITDAGGCLKDVQDLMGHKSIRTTQMYIDSNEDAKKKLISML